MHLLDVQQHEESQPVVSSEIFEGTIIVAVISNIRTPVEVTYDWLCYVQKGTPNCAKETARPGD